MMMTKEDPNNKEAEDRVFCRFTDGEEFTIPIGIFTHIKSNNPSGVLKITTSPIVSQKAHHGIDVEYLSVSDISDELIEMYDEVEVRLNCNSFNPGKKDGSRKPIIHRISLGEGVTSFASNTEMPYPDENEVRLKSIEHLPDTLKLMNLSPNNGEKLNFDAPLENIEEIKCDDTVVINNLDELLKEGVRMVELSNEHRESQQESVGVVDLSNDDNIIISDHTITGIYGESSTKINN